MPVWKDLTKSELPKPSDEGAGVKDDKVLKQAYKEQGEKLKESLSRNEELLASLRDAESVRHELSRQLHKATQDAKFDKIAADGIAKKAQLHEFENTQFKAERKTMLEEQTFSRKRIKELELALNDIRAKHLTTVHENELLKRDKQEMMINADKAARDAVEANKKLMEKLQRVETLESVNASQKRVIDSQGGEMNNMTMEMTMIKEDMRSLTQTINLQEQTIASKSLDSDILEREVSKLKKSVMGLAVSTSEKSLAYTNTFSSNEYINAVANNRGRGRVIDTTNRNLENRALRNGGGSSVFGSASDSYNRGQSRHRGQLNVSTSDSLDLEVSVHSPIKTGAKSGSVVSPQASPYSTHLKSNTMDMTVLGMDRISTAHSTRARDIKTAGANDDGNRMAFFDDGGDMGSMGRSTLSGGLDSTEPSLDDTEKDDLAAEMAMKAAMAMEAKKRADFQAKAEADGAARIKARGEQQRATVNLSGRNRTRFLGQGLGMKQSGAGDFNPSGSAKSVLKKIMADFEAGI